MSTTWLPANPAQRTQVVPPPMVGGPLPAAFEELLDRVIDPKLKSDPFGDDRKLEDLFKKLKDEAFDQRWVYERLWWRNLLYVLGRQWIYYDTRRGQWLDKRMARWIPRPVTNKMAETLDAIRSVFSQVQLGIKARPLGWDTENVSTAETVDNIAPAIQQEHEIPRIMREFDFWFITTGNAILHPWWDKRAEQGPITLPYERCFMCQQNYLPAEIQDAGGMCPACGTPTLGQALDEQGQPMVLTHFAGRGRTDVISPFEIAFPPSYSKIEDVPYAIRQRWRTRVWCEDHLPPEVTKKLTWEKTPHERSLQLVRALATQNDIGTSTLAYQAEDGGKQEGMTEYELWMKPNEVYEKGLFLRVLGSGGNYQIVRMPDESTPGPLPYATIQGNPIFPFVHATYQDIGGRLWGRGPLDDIVQKQDQINQIDSLMQLIIQRTANPVWLEPKGAEVKKFTGEPGLVVRYNPLTVGGSVKPERIEGSNVPMSLIQIRQQLYMDIEQLAGTYDVIKGAKPTGVEAFSALQLLVERSQSRFTLPLEERGEAYRQWFTVAIELERQFGPDERTWSVLGPNQAWTYQKFERAKLQGAIDIIIEDGSKMPKTSLGKRAAIEQLNQLGLIDRQNPDTQYAILRSFGQTDLIPSLDFHVKAALQEQDAFEQWAAVAQQGPPQPQIDPYGQPLMDPTTGQAAMAPGMPFPPPQGFGRKPWHDDQVHWTEHRKWANGDKVRELLQMKPWLEPFVAFMLQEHEMALQAQMMAQQQMQAGPGGEGGGGGRALANSNREQAQAQEPRGTGQRADNRGPE